MLVLVMAVSLVPMVSSADKDDHSAAEMIRDDAISKIVAWRTKSAETVLRKAPEHELTQPYLTAEALLMATYSLGQNAEFVQEALEILENQAEKDPADPVAEFYRGEVLRWLDRPNDARVAWTGARDRSAAAVKKRSKNATARYYLGASLVRLNRPAEARKALKRAAKDGFSPTMVDFQIGLTYLSDNNWKAAKNSFDAVHEFDPRYAHLYFYRGLASTRLGDRTDAARDLREFITLAPNSPEAAEARKMLSLAG
jgi:tetratricopeptide (TPR) repeat protein